MGMGIFQQAGRKTFAPMLRMGGYGIDIGQFAALIAAVEPVQRADRFARFFDTAAAIGREGHMEKSVDEAVGVAEDDFPQLLQTISIHSRPPSDMPSASQ